MPAEAGVRRKLVSIKAANMPEDETFRGNLTLSAAQSGSNPIDIQSVHFFLDLLLDVGSLVADIFSAKTCFTHFCSSMRKARTMRILTHLAHLEPPYARLMDRLRFLSLRYSIGLSAGMPMRRFLQSPQCGPFALFFTTRAISRPPGVRSGRILFDLVL